MVFADANETAPADRQGCVSTNDNPTPPRLADRLLTWFCVPHLREEVLGDLHERYVLRLLHWREMLAYVRPSIIKRQAGGQRPNPNSYGHATELSHNRFPQSGFWADR